MKLGGYIKAVPSTLVAMLAVTTASVLIPMDVPRIGAIPRSLPSVALPEFEMAELMLIIKPALVLAIVGALDSLLTSLVADAVTKTRHDSEQELVAQGLGDFFSGVLGGLPGAGATMRTVANVSQCWRSRSSLRRCARASPAGRIVGDLSPGVSDPHGSAGGDSHYGRHWHCRLQGFASRAQCPARRCFGDL